MLNQEQVQILNDIYSIDKSVKEWEDSLDQTFLSPKEYFVKIASYKYTETEIADMLDVEVGTVRGKKGRIKKKQRKAKNTFFPKEVAMER